MQMKNLTLDLSGRKLLISWKVWTLYEPYTNRSPCKCKGEQARVITWWCSDRESSIIDRLVNPFLNEMRTSVEDCEQQQLSKVHHFETVYIKVSAWDYHIVTIPWAIMMRIPYSNHRYPTLSMYVQKAIKREVCGRWRQGCRVVTVRISLFNDLRSLKCGHRKHTAIWYP